MNGVDWWLMMLIGWLMMVIGWLNDAPWWFMRAYGWLTDVWRLIGCELMVDGCLASWWLMINSSTVTGFVVSTRNIHHQWQSINQHYWISSSILIRKLISYCLGIITTINREQTPIKSSFIANQLSATDVNHPASCKWFQKYQHHY